VTSHTKRYVRCFWGLDRERAQARFYPAIHPLQSYSDGASHFAAWWTERGNPEWGPQRECLLALLEAQADLERMARIVGKDALPPGQQLTLLCAELVNESFLRQSAFSPVDRFCSPERQTAMLKLILHFVALAQAALARGVAPQAMAELEVLRRLQRMGEEIGEDQLDKFTQLSAAVETAFAGLGKAPSHAA
jgi:V/A-type H+/Na+-transporting ATPase subunit A